MAFHKQCERCQQMHWAQLKRQAVCNACRRIMDMQRNQESARAIQRRDREFERMNSGPMLDARLQLMVDNELALPWEKVKA